MRAKKFVQYWLGLLVGFFLLNLVLWQGWTSQVFFESEDGHGDLRRIGSFAAAQAKTKPVEYAQKHVEFKDYAAAGAKEEFDVLTIGDSFSNGGGGNYYQDDLADRYGLRVLNVPCNAFGDGNALSILYALQQTGYLEELHPKAVIIESVEHYLASRFNGHLPERPVLSREEFLHKELPAHTEADGIREDKIFTPIMIKANAEFLKNKWYACGHEGALSETADYAELSRDCFTAPGQQRLLLYYHLETSFAEDRPAAEEIHANMQEAADMLRGYGSRLIFLPVVGKLDLYHPYLQEQQRFAENTTFAELMAEPQDYVQLDTKKILRKALADGVPDLYWNDDTHWSWRAQQLIVDALVSEGGLQGEK